MSHLPIRARYATAALLVACGVACGCGSAGNSTSTVTPPTPTPTPTPAAITVQAFETTGDGTQLLAQQPSLAFSSAAGTGSYTIQVTPSTVLQPWDGVGGALTDSAATVLAALPAAQQTTVLTQLFSPTSGIGLNMVRIPMGASDMSASGDYSYDDVPAGQTDPTLVKFSIAHDTKTIIPLLQEAQTLNSNLKIIAAPWSPPAWMKNNGSMNGNYGAPVTMSQIYSDDFPQLSSYFVKFIEAYQAKGLPIYAISAQNEPQNSQTTYPSAILTATDEASFIANDLGPAMESAGLSSVKIFGLEDNYSQTAYAQTLLQSAASPYLAGTSFHWYNGTVSQMSTVQALDTTKGVWFTEFSGTVPCSPTCPTLTGSDFSGSGLQYEMQNLIMAVPQNHGRSIVAWNLALNQNEGPQNGGCTDCVGVVTVNTSTSTPAVYLNGSFYSLGHIGKFVVPGANVIATTPGTTTGVQSVGFQNPDGSLVVVAFNGASTATALTVAWDNQTFNYTLPAQSAVTFKWTP